MNKDEKEIRLEAYTQFGYLMSYDEALKELNNIIFNL